MPQKNNFTALHIAAGIHPQYIADDPDSQIAELRTILNDNKNISAIGEIGLDYRKDMPDRELQKEIEELNNAFMKDATARQAQEQNASEIKDENERVITKAKMDNLDDRLLSKFLKASGVLESGRGDFLTSMELAAKDGTQLKPTGLGMLLFAKRPQSIYPNAVVKTILKKNGKVVETQTFEGNISKQLDDVAEWYKRNLPTHINRDMPERKSVYDYPLEVVREIICNALVHRDYSIKGAPIHFEINDNCIIVRSPGLPKPPISIEQIKAFSAPSFSRNPVIMYVLDKLNYVEQRGLGFETIRNLPNEELPLPRVLYNAPYVEFTLPLTKQSAIGTLYKDLSENEMKVLQLIQMSGKFSRNDVQNHLSIGEKTAVRILNKLKEKGYIVSVGAARNISYVINDKKIP